MTHDLLQNSTHIKTSASMPFNLSAIALFVLMLGLGLAYALDALVNRVVVPSPSQYSAPFLTQTLAGKVFRIPKIWFHEPVPVNGEFTDQIDLNIQIQFEQNGSLIPIDLRMVATGRAQPSAYLLDAVYLRQFSGQQVSGPVGLVGKPLRDNDGFQNETIWYDPLSPFPFVAKCIEAVSPGEPATCLRTVQLPGQIAMTYQFDAEILVYWKQFDTVLEPWLRKFGALSVE